MIGTIGDLVEDVVVHLGGPINLASDTDASVTRRRGGSAANMAVNVALAGGEARFIGQVGDDALGARLVAELIASGVDPSVRQAGRSGTVVVLVDHLGERTMLSDRASCAELTDPDPRWLDGLHTLHVPVYSLLGEPLASTAATLIGWAHERSIRVSIDASSSAVLERQGRVEMLDLLTRLAPDVLLCNELEAASLGGAEMLAAIGLGLVVIKQGAGAAIVLHRQELGAVCVEHVPAVSLLDVRDTTGAGDAFAAGLLRALADGVNPVEATVFAHRVAANAIRRVSITT